MLAISRIMVAWQPVGLSMGVYDMVARYLKEREQFGAPLASFQARHTSFAVISPQHSLQKGHTFSVASNLHEQSPFGTRNCLT